MTPDKPFGAAVVYLLTGIFQAFPQARYGSTVINGLAT